MKIDVCIPVHDPLNVQSRFLDFLLFTISTQTVLPARVLLTANHKIKNLTDYKRQYDSKFELYFELNSTTGISENLNHVVSLASNEIVKILFQDDFLIYSSHFEELIKVFSDHEERWSCSPSKNYSEHEMRYTKETIPIMSHLLKYGNNSIGSPSVIALRRESWLDADTNLKWMLDCDLYLCMLEKHGNPFITQKFAIASRIHSNQATNWSSIFHETELEYMKNKHS